MIIARRTIDGSKFSNSGTIVPTQIILQSGSATYESPPGCVYIDVLCIGAGGAGIRTSQGGGGGGGAWFKKIFDAGIYSYTTGTGGGVNASGTASVFGGTTAGGGTKGHALYGGEGGVVSGSGFYDSQKGTDAPILSTATYSSPGGSSYFGDFPQSVNNSDTDFDILTRINSSSGFGCGGAGVSTSKTAGGLGCDGIIFITEHYSSPPTFTTLISGSGNYTSPVGCKYILVLAVGGGGSGSVAPAPGGSGGSGGGWFTKQYVAGTYAYVVGTGGAAVTSTYLNGLNGVSTTFGGDIAYLGYGGLVVQSNANAILTGSNVIEKGMGGKGQFANSPATISTCGGTSYSSYFVSSYDPVNTVGFASKINAPANSGCGGGGQASAVSATTGSGAAGKILIEEHYV